MILAFIALVAALSGTAVALPGKNTIDSADIKKGQVKNSDVGKNAITGTKVKNNSLKGADVLESSLGKVPAAAHADTADTADSASNATQLGGKGTGAYLQYTGTIPSGTTVIGNWFAGTGGGTFSFAEITIPAAAPVGLTSTTVNMGAGTTNGADNDATCTGTATAPTAPAGKLCFYVGFQTGLTTLEGFGSNGPATRGGAIRVDGAAAAYARGGWAYTAP